MHSTGKDSKANLLALRKFYNRLASAGRVKNEKTQGSDDVFQEIIMAESARRLAQKKFCGSRNKSTVSPTQVLEQAESFQKLLQSIKISDKSLDLPMPGEALIREILEHGQILEYFDERFAGYLYQFSCLQKRSAALARIQQANKKSSRQDIILFTQLYTPDWAADYLLVNTLYTRWLYQKRESESLKSWMKWLHPGGTEEIDFKNQARISGVSDKDREKTETEGTRAKLKQARDLRIIDPACGAGHILLRAFELFLDLYRAEGIAEEDAVLKILNHNLYGADIDADALSVCAVSLLLKSSLKAELNQDIKLGLLCAARKSASNADEDFEQGSLGRGQEDSILKEKAYDAVVSNPPYIGRRLMDRRMKSFLKSEYPTARQDLSAAFLLRSIELCNESGLLGFLTQSSIIYLPSYAELRQSLLEENLLESVVELGPGVFPLASGEKINSMLLVLRKGKESGSSKFLDLKESIDKMAELGLACRGSLKQKQTPSFLHRKSESFLSEKNAAFNYNFPEIFGRIAAASEKLGSRVEIKQGLATGDNARFLRYVWDIDMQELGKRWHPYVKGAGSNRWYAACRTVIDWGEAGEKIKMHVEQAYPYLKGKVSWVVKNEQFYFRPGLTFSFVSTGNLAVRRLPAGAIFDVGGSALFGKKNDEDFLLSFLNSSFAAVFAEYMNPTFNFQVGDIKRIPLPDFDTKERSRLSEISQRAFELKRSLERFDESALGYLPAPEFEAINTGVLNGREAWERIETERSDATQDLQALDCEIDEIVADCIGRTFAMDRRERLALLQLTEAKRSRAKEARPAISNAKELASSFLRNWIKDLEFSSNFLSCSRARPFEKLLREDLRNWLESEFGDKLSNYLEKQFNREQEITFYGHPQVLCVPEKESNILVFISSSSLRSLLRKCGFSQGIDSHGHKVANELAAALCGMQDWTGKDMFAALRKTSQSARITLK